MLETSTESTSCTKDSMYSTYCLLFPSRFSNCTCFYYIIASVLLKILQPGVKNKNKEILK